MKVLQLSKFYPPVMGGIEAVAWELTEGLNRAGVATDVLCSSHRWGSVQQIDPGGHAIAQKQRQADTATAGSCQCVTTQLLVMGGEILPGKSGGRSFVHRGFF